MTTKASLREQFLKKRMALTRDEIDSRNKSITSHLVKIPDESAVKSIHAFLPQVGKNEVNTWAFIHAIWEKSPNIQLVVPRVIPGTREMHHYLLQPQTVLIANRWNIPEPDPRHSVKVEPNTLDIILIPLLAFDQKGFRVGYGGGYYDRFLKQCRPDAVKIGLSFFGPADEIEDVDENDIPLNMCVTPEYIYQF